jgi:hypothetical protein
VKQDGREKLNKLEDVPISSLKEPITSLLFVNDDRIVCHDAYGQSKVIERQLAWKAV